MRSWLTQNSLQTIQLTRLQVGDDCNKPAYIIASTLVEVENIVPLLKEYQARGREVNVRILPD